MSADKPISYRWEINHKRVLNPSPLLLYGADKGPVKPMLSIDCPRGAHPGKAYLLMRREDAGGIIGIATPQVIKITEFEQSVDGAWSESNSTEFGHYYALSSSCAFGKIQDQVIVELADERYKLSETHVRKKFNMTIREAVGATPAEYDPDTTNSGDLYTYGEILDEILSAVEDPPSLFLPVDPDPPTNLFFDCSVADAIDQLLASIGCALLFDPTAESGEEFSVDELSIDQDLDVLDQAKSDGRLIETFNPKNSQNVKPKNIIVYPAKFITLEANAKLVPELPDQSGSPSTDFPSVAIFDHELTPDVARISEAVDAWYKTLDAPLDDVYQGILIATTGSNITSITWAYTEHGHRTFIKNLLQSRIPWPKQPVLVTGGGGSRRANAVLDANMTPDDDFVSVVSIQPIEGAGDDEPIDAANVLRWYGIAGNKCKIEYNPNFNNGPEEEPGGWELYAIEENYTLECPVIEVEP